MADGVPGGPQDLEAQKGQQQKVINLDTELRRKVCAAEAALKKFQRTITNALQFDEKMVLALEIYFREKH